METSGIGSFDTKQSQIHIYKAKAEVLNEPLYVIISIHICDYKMNVRYGNKTQLINIINTYSCDKRNNTLRNKILEVLRDE